MNSASMGKSDMRYVIALFAIVTLGSAVGNLSQTAVNAMLGAIDGDFGVSAAVGQWLSTIYMLVLGITVPAVTFVAKRFTVRQHVLAAIIVFLLGAACCAVAPSFAVVFVGRVFQAIAAGMLMPLMQNIAMMRFPDGSRATAMGVAGVALGFAPNIGPTIGGAMVDAFGWRSFFLLLVGIMIALGIAALVVVKREGEQDRTARLEAMSLLLSTLGFGGLLLGFSNASSFGLANPYVWVPVAVGTVFLVLFVRRQLRLEGSAAGAKAAVAGLATSSNAEPKTHADEDAKAGSRTHEGASAKVGGKAAAPLISMQIFKNRQFVIGFIGQCLLNASFMGITLIIPLYVEELCGGTALQAGLVLLPATVAALVFNPLGGILTDRIGVRPVVLIAGACLSVGSVAMVLIDRNTPLWMVMLFQGIRAVGVSFMIGPITSWSLNDLPRTLMADGSSFSIVVRQACASLGTSVMVCAITLVGASAAGVAWPALAYHVAFGVSAALSVATFLYCAARVR